MQRDQLMFEAWCNLAQYADLCGTCKHRESREVSRWQEQQGNKSGESHTISMTKEQDGPINMVKTD